MSTKRSASNLDGPGPSSKSQSKKKTRFVSPSEDPANFESQVNDALENPSASRKGRVNADGYDSDSSDDGEGVVLSRRKGEEGEGENDDMFAMAEDDESKKGGGKDSGGKKKKKEEFMRLGDIEGQEFNDAASDDDDTGSDEPEDEDDAERRRKAGMGYEMSHFNMRDEMEEGRFSADGMYVKAFDPLAVHDRWMDDVDEKEIKKARRVKKRMERAEKEKQLKEDEEMESKDQQQQELIGLLRKGETVLEALARLGAQAKKEKAATKSTESNGSSTAQPHADPSTQSDIDKITSLASQLMVSNLDIYSETYESLLRSIRSQGNVEPDWVPPTRDVKYEYRWAEGEGDREVFGPFSEEEMRSWFGAAYFGSAGEKIEVRQVGKQWGDWEEVVGS